jgi:ABC-type multidrug transport system ATPase subunit
MIKEFKHHRLIILTTHSMEEADTLGEKIAIMANGKLRYIKSISRLG